MEFIRPLLIVIVTACLSFSAHANIIDAKTLNKEIAKQTEYSNIKQLMAAYNIPGISLAVIKNKRLQWAEGFGVIQAGKADKIDSQTLFSVGSISKVGTAMLTLKQVDEGKFNLDENVNSYLKQWKVPVNRYTKERPITLKNILSHTAGFSVHGFGDFQPGEKLPTTVDILNGNYPAKNYPVRVIFKPGTQYKYSGGGTTVQQLVLEDTFNSDFEKLAAQKLFKPLQMMRSSYQNPLPTSLGNIAKAHNGNGEPRALPRGYEAMAEEAASGLWTTPTDLSKIVISLMRSYHGEKDTFLSSKLTRTMMTPVGPSEYGLGPEIENGFVFHHGGSNDSYKAFFQGNLETGDGFIVFTNGAKGGMFIRALRAVLNKSI